MDKHSPQPRPPTRFDWNDLLRRADQRAGGLGDSEETLSELLRQIERKRKLLVGISTSWRHSLEFHGRSTLVSLRLEGMHISESEVVEALLKGGVRGDLRSRQTQMIRNHVAILLTQDLALQRQIPLSPATVLGWHAALCAGLPTPAMAETTLRRLEHVCRQVNSPPMRLQAAISNIADLHFRLLQDPLVSSFNGVISRLLLHYHLSRCDLPQVIFHQQADRLGFTDEHQLFLRLVVLIAARLDELTSLDRK